MADNITLNSGSSGATLATDQNGAVEHYQLIKLVHGALDSFTLVSTSSGLPVQSQGTFTVTLAAGTNTNEVVGDVAQDIPVAGNPVLIGGRGSTAAPTDMSADGDAVYLWTTLKGALNVADAGGSLTVDGTVTANLAAGTNNIGDVDVLTVPADPFGANADAASSTGSISAKLRFIAATGIPVTGSVALGATTRPAATTMQNAATANGNGTNLDVTGYATALLNIVTSVDASGGTTMNFEASVDDTTFVPIYAYQVGSTTYGTTALNNAMEADWVVACAGYKSVRARISAYSAGTITVKGYALEQAPALPAVMAVDGGGSLTVDNAGTFAVQAAQSGTWTVSSFGSGTTGPQKAEDVASADADVGIPAMAVRKATPANTSGTDGDYEFLQMSAGRLWASATIDAALPTGSNTIGNVNPGTAANWGVYVEDAAETAGGNLSMAGSVRRDAPASSAGTTGDNATVNTTAQGGLWVTPTPTDQGGLSVINSTSSDGGTALTSTAQAIKASAGQLYGYYIYNPNSSAQFVQFYNTAAGSVTVGTTNPLFMLTIPATAGAHVEYSHGIAFGTAMSWSATSTAGGNGAPTTSLDAVCFYK